MATVIPTWHFVEYRSDPFGFVRKIIRSVEHYIGFTDGRGNDGASSVAMDISAPAPRIQAGAA